MCWAFNLFPRSETKERISTFNKIISVIQTCFYISSDFFIIFIFTSKIFVPFKWTMNKFVKKKLLIFTENSLGFCFFHFIVLYLLYVEFFSIHLVYFVVCILHKFYYGFPIKCSHERPILITVFIIRNHIYKFTISMPVLDEWKALWNTKNFKNTSFNKYIILWWPHQNHTFAMNYIAFFFKKK